MSRQILHIVLNNFTNDSRVLRECKALAAAGYKVQVFALHESGLALTEASPTYNLRRFALATRGLPKSFFWQTFKYAECVWKMVWQGRKLRPVLVHAHDRNALPIGFLVSRLAGAKLIYDSHELWGHTAHTAKRPGFFNRMAAAMERFAARKAQGVITVSDSIVRHMQDNMGLEDITLVRNLPYLKRREAYPRDTSPLRLDLGIDPEKIVLLYQGVVSRHRGLELIVRAAEFLSEQFTVVVLGNGVIVPELKELARSLGPEERVKFHSAVSPESLIEYSSGADLGFSLTEDTCLNNRYSLPNKLFEYLQAGLPVIVSNLPEMKSVVEANGVGLVLPNWDPQAAAQAINKLADRDRISEYNNNVLAASQNFCWDKEQKKLIELYTRALAG